MLICKKDIRGVKPPPVVLPFPLHVSPSYASYNASQVPASCSL